MFLLFGAFIAGILTVLAPCVLPLLPVVIGGSLGGTQDRRRPILIAISLSISLLVFTLLLKETTVLISLPPNVIAYFSGGIIIALGFAMLFPVVYAKLMASTGIEQHAQVIVGRGMQSKSEWIGPIIIGLALGPVFSSCSPVYIYILATVLPAHFGLAFIYMISYILGLTLILLALSVYGQRLTRRLRFMINPKGYFQRSLAIIFILVGLAIVTGFGTKIQVFIAEHTPYQFDTFVSKFIPKGNNAPTDTGLYNVSPYKAPELTGIQAWINSKPLMLSKLHGKVVLIDFWTYTCINCIRALPYTQGWYSQYQKDGLVVIGVEAPEFAYEKIPSNVAAAVKQDGLTYPIAIDGNLATWNVYQNQYWPAEYLIDGNGNVRRVHFGEGEYDATEQAIRGLLMENNTVLSLPKTLVTGSVAVPISNNQTPETYLGTDRADAYEGAPALGSQPDQAYSFTSNLDVNHWTLSGAWHVSGSTITAGKNAQLRISVNAKDVYLVGGASTPANVTVKFDGMPISKTGNAGSDVVDSQVRMQLSNLYRIAHFKAFTSGTIELDVPEGVSLNTFTFGS